MCDPEVPESRVGQADPEGHDLYGRVFSWKRDGLKYSALYRILDCLLFFLLFVSAIEEESP